MIGEQAGAALHAPDAHGVLELAGGLGGEQQRQAVLDRGLHRLAELHRRAVGGVVARRTAPSRAGGAGGAGSGSVTTRSASSACSLPSAVRVAAAAHEHAAPAVERVARGRRGSTRRPSSRVSASASALGGVDVLARAGVQGVRVPALEQLGDRVGRAASPTRRSRVAASRRARRARGSRPARRSGSSSQPPPGAGVEEHADRALDRARPAQLARRRAPASACEASRQQRRSSASKASGCASAQRESCVAGGRVQAEPARERAPAVRRRDPDGRVVEVDRQLRVRAPQRVVERARGRGDARPVQAGRAVGLAPARAISARTACSSSRVGAHGRDAVAAQDGARRGASASIQMSGSLGSTGRSSASASARRGAQPARRRIVDARRSSGELAAGVGRQRAAELGAFGARLRAIGRRRRGGARRGVARRVGRRRVSHAHSCRVDRFECGRPAASMGRRERARVGAADVLAASVVGDAVRASTAVQQAGAARCGRHRSTAAALGSSHARAAAGRQRLGDVSLACDARG